MEKIDLPQFLLDKGLHKITSDGDIIIVDPWKIAKDNKINIYEADLIKEFEDDSISGFIRNNEGEFEIYLEKSHHYNRKRFTLAHELGHYFLHMKGEDAKKIFVDDKDCTLFRSSKYNKKEKEANEFAAEYLMPEKVVREQYERYGITELLAGFFNVSRMAMAFRIDNVMGTND